MQWSLRIALFAIWALAILPAPRAAPTGTRFEIALPQAIQNPVNGRLFLAIGRQGDPEPRLQIRWYDIPPLFARDVRGLRPGESAIIDDAVPGYPVASIRDLPPGDYFVQALLDVYTDYHRADGYTLSAPPARWHEGQFNVSPGNLYSRPQRVHLDIGQPGTIRMALTEAVPPVAVPPDTQWVKRIRIQSSLLSRFWGRPMYLGAVVLLPRDYDAGRAVRYPAIYQLGHLSLQPPFGFSTSDMPETPEQRKKRAASGTETGFEFHRRWTADDFPRVIAVTLQHPTPFNENSSAVNSANTGPYGDAIVTELIPYLEQHFRMLSESRARLLTGTSAGGWQALALQIFHPDFFGGAWSVNPAPVDFRRFWGGMNIYEDGNAFELQTDIANELGGAAPLERNLRRTADGQPVRSVRELSRIYEVFGPAVVLDQQDVFGPVGEEVYPQLLWDRNTGHIDRGVATYWHDRDYDLSAYLQKSWPRIGPMLTGKLHFFCGEMDDYYFNLGLYLLQDFLEHRAIPAYGGSFAYGRPSQGHAWQPMTNEALVRVMTQNVSPR